MSTRLFIYGTLKKGGRLHRHMEGQKFIGKVKTAPKYRLYAVGWFPGLYELPSEDDDVGKSIEGELYEVDDECLARLDRVEGVPSLYQRRAVTVQNAPASDNGEDLIQSYFYNKDVSELSDAGTNWPVGGE